ncbi:hypothetical protein CP532_2978 [Ophiocordyceps camponoti-leonardi (nom. inval.)]|nr:hypothetical protein CP532_2978 [Ophiocordyceps camponoti-leonardi (nom. inval.)]
MPSRRRPLPLLRWLPPPPPPPSLPRLRLRAWSSRCGPERVDVRCGTAGHVSVRLFNGAHDARNRHALVIHLPSSPAVDDDAAAPLPTFLQHLPVAQINYRWGGDASRAFHWPRPVHETSFAYAWLHANLAPPSNAGRDIFVFGSHLGASLAASLALTETHDNAKFDIRGLVAYNGIYNWTMFMPEHRINKLASKTSPSVQKLQSRLPSLFRRPSDLLDPFASPSLFFHSPGLLAPRWFASANDDDDTVWDQDEQAATVSLKPPRKSLSVFPPPKSSLRIPETFLLHHDGGDDNGTKAVGHSLRSQARELALLMRRSIVESEKRGTVEWDEKEDADVADEEAQMRVQAVDAGPLTDEAGFMALDWMRERTDAM